MEAAFRPNGLIKSKADCGNLLTAGVNQTAGGGTIAEGRVKRVGRVSRLGASRCF